MYSEMRVEQLHLRKNMFLIYGGIIAVCFLYTGSAYMSQFYRLMELYDGAAVDLITSGWNYIMQAIGIAIFALGLWRKPSFFGRKWLFISLLLIGGVFMSLSQLCTNGALIILFGFVFNLLIGVYFGFYLTMLAAGVPAKHTGLCYGAAYAIGSVGTYLFSLINDGAFLTSKEITVVYLFLMAVTVGIVLISNDIVLPSKGDETQDKPPYFIYIVPIIVIMVIISVTGSGLYYSLPQSENVNWNLTRLFYAVGLIAAGIIHDKSRFIGGLITVASLTYPVIATALFSGGVNGTIALSLSYLFRGFLSVYCICTFTDFGAKNSRLLPLSSLGLCVSRTVEALLSFLLIYVNIPEIAVLIIAAIFFAPLILFFALYYSKLYSPSAFTHEKRLALFSVRYGLTARESEVLQCLTDGLSDNEISNKCYISKSTVRFHISNILKKTGCHTRVEVVRSMNRSE